MTNIFGSFFVCSFFVADLINGPPGVESVRENRIRKRSANIVGDKDSKSLRTSLPPPPTQKIVYVNPSQEFYLGRNHALQKEQSVETEEDDRESREFSQSPYYDDPLDYQRSGSKVKHVKDRDMLKNNLFVKHDDRIENDETPSGKQLFTPNQQQSFVSEEEEEYVDHSSDPHKNTFENIIPQLNPNQFPSLTPQSSHRVNTIQSLDSFSVRSHDWKHDILEEMRVSLTNCCIQCKTQTLMHLEKTLQLIHRYLTRELDEHYAEITSSLRTTTGRDLAHAFPGEHDGVRDDEDRRFQQNPTPDCDIAKVPLKHSKSNRQIVQVQLNDDVSDNFKKIVFKVTKPDGKSFGNKRKASSGALGKLKALRQEAIRQRQTLRDETN